jgi:hypothetical protein
MMKPRIASWDILSRPFGTVPWRQIYPGLTSWATLSRPFGTVPIQLDRCPKSADGKKTNLDKSDSQPSLRDWSLELQVLTQGINAVQNECTVVSESAINEYAFAGVHQLGVRARRPIVAKQVEAGKRVAHLRHSEALLSPYTCKRGLPQLIWTGLKNRKDLPQRLKPSYSQSSTARLKVVP